MLFFKKFVSKFWFVIGPGLVVMLADTDAGSLIGAAQGGAMYGYRMVFLMLLLAPILFFAQELTVRLGVITQQGHGELIKNHFGPGWAWLSVSTLIVSCFGAIISEFAGIAGVGHLFGVPSFWSVGSVIFLLILMVCTGGYRTVERCAILIGLFELVFVAVAILAHPHYHEAMSTMFDVPWQDRSYWYLAAGLVGAVIMPWMIFYQQSAVIDKKLTVEHLPSARLDTAIGAVITQVIMASMVTITAVSIGHQNPGVSLDTVEQISQALTPFLGYSAGKFLFAFGMLGAAIVAAIVVSLTAAWGLGEVLGYKRSLEHSPREAPFFYGVYTLMLLLGGGVVLSNVNTVRLVIGVLVLNAVLLPIVLGFLYFLGIKALPEPYKLKGSYRIFLGVLLGFTAAFGLFAGLSGLF